MRILVLNAGSATVKFGLYAAAAEGATASSGITVLARGIADSLNTGSASIRFDLPAGGATVPIGGSTAPQAARRVLEMATHGELESPSGSSGPSTSKTAQHSSEPGGRSAGLTDVNKAVRIDAIGCRVVHGGAAFSQPTRVSPTVLDEIRSLARLAPLHNSIDADVIEAAGLALPGVPVIAVFDTAFHHTLPVVASIYALPWDLCRTHGLRRYGFHGISHRYVSERLVECLGRTSKGSRLITCHLGNGSSICAVRDGRSIDTSMGLTPLEGLVMGTRCGDVDPGLLLYLLQSLRMTAHEVDDMLNHKSGLAGLAGHNGDVRELDAAARAGDARAEMALEVFAYRASKYIGAYSAAMEGLDAVAFTGGIGEHSSGVRERICRRLAFLGLTLDAGKNASAAGQAPCRITADACTVQAWVIPTDEEGQIAREAAVALGTSNA